MFKRTLSPTAFVCAAILAAAALIAYAGPIDPPPGPVAPTYKTLTEVEPRTAINAANTPGDADSLFKITQPGSYYLTGNVTGVAGKHGVEIAVAANGPSVTIDLMGYELAGVAGSLDGISVTVVNTRNVAVRNGTVRAWGGDGIDVVNSTNNRLQDLRVDANGARGIFAGTASTVTGCTGSFNTDDGIFANTGSTVTGCTANTNTGNGISAAAGSTVMGCTASFNGGANNGIFAGPGSTVTGCTASFNTGDGIFASTGSTVTGCTANSNTGDGIRIQQNSRVTDNTCDANGTGGIGSGIHTDGSGNRIEGNIVTRNQFGILVDANVAGNLVIRNHARGNSTNYSNPVSGNFIGTLIGTSGDMNSATNSLINIAN